MLSVVGVSHHACPVGVREQFALPADGAFEAVGEGLRETAWLSTCNRIELYAVADEAGAVEDAFARVLHVPSGLVNEYARVRSNVEAARHLFRVAGGLESAVLGESEILGQVRRALADAQARGAAGPLLTRLFEGALGAGKRVRSETGLGHCPVSVSSAAIALMQERDGRASLDQASVLVLGAGDLGRAVARCLKGANVRAIAVANRTPSRARALADEVGGEAIAWPPTPEALARFDAVISCTSAPAFVLTHTLVEAAMRRSASGRRLHLIDMAVPRDVEPGVADIPGVRLSNIDDARDVVDDSLSRRSDYVEAAERIIEEQLGCFTEWLTARSASESIRALKEHADLIRQGELEWAMPKLASLSPGERAVVEQLSTRLVNKLLHAPTLRLREGAEPRLDADEFESRR